MSITRGYVTATQERAEVANTTSGVYTWPSYVNTALVSNTSGDVAYIRLLTGSNDVFNGEPRSFGNWTGTGWTYDGANFVTSGAGSNLEEVAGSLEVGKSYRTRITVVEIASGDQFNLVLGTTNGTTRSSAGTFTELLACAGNTRVSIAPDGAVTATIRNIIAEQLATDVIGEYDILLPDGETIDITRDSREVIYGFSVWIPTGATAGKINARGRVTPGRNKIACPP